MKRKQYAIGKQNNMSVYLVLVNTSLTYCSCHIVIQFALANALRTHRRTATAQYVSDYVTEFKISCCDRTQTAPYKRIVCKQSGFLLAYTSPLFQSNTSETRHRDSLYACVLKICITCIPRDMQSIKHVRAIGIQWYICV